MGLAAVRAGRCSHQPGDHEHQHHRVARAQRLSCAADVVQAAHVQRLRVRGQLHTGPRPPTIPWVLRVGRRCERRRVSRQQQRHRVQLWPGVLRRPEHIFSMAGSYQVPIGRDRAYGTTIEQATRLVGGWLGCFPLRRHGAHRLPDHRAGQLEPVPPGDTFDAVAGPVSANRWRTTPRSNMWLNPIGVPVGGARHLRQRRRGHRTRTEVLERGLLAVQAVRHLRPAVPAGALADAGRFIEWKKYRLRRLQSEMRTEFEKSKYKK